MKEIEDWLHGKDKEMTLKEIGAKKPGGDRPCLGDSASMKKRKLRRDDEDPVKLPKRQKLAEAARSCQKITDIFDTRIVRDLGMDMDVNKEGERMEVEHDIMFDQGCEATLMMEKAMQSLIL